MGEKYDQLAARIPYVPYRVDRWSCSRIRRGRRVACLDAGGASGLAPPSLVGISLILAAIEKG